MQFSVQLRRSLVRDLRNRQMAESTIKQYTALTQRFVEWLPVPVEEVDRGLMLEWINEGKTPSQQRWRYLALNSFGRMLVAEEIIDRNPTDRIAMPTEPETVQPILADGDLAAMLDVCKRKTWAGSRDYALLLTIASTGMRRSEITNMDADDVDFDSMRVSVPRTKSKRPRSVFFDDETSRAILRWMRFRDPSHEALWLSQRGGRLTPDGLLQMIYRRAEEAGVKASTHMFRRRFAANWMLDGGSQTTLQTAAGWKSGAMVNIYTRMVAEEIAEAEYRRLNDQRTPRHRRRRQRKPHNPNGHQS